MAGQRRYDDPCGVARALDLLAERWALLVVRELLLGPKRFADLVRGLPSASQNVLSQRLRELDAAGILRRRALGPPSNAQVYELTGRGRELEPVLLALGTWGSRAPLASAAELSVDALMLALRTTFDPVAAGELRATIEVGLGPDRYTLSLADRSLHLARGRSDVADARLETDSATLRRLTLGGEPLASMRNLDITGDAAVVGRLLGCFRRPAHAAV